MKTLILFLSIIMVRSCQTENLPQEERETPEQPAREITPVRHTWADLMQMPELKAGFEKKDSSYWLDGHFINTSIKVCLFRCSNNVFVVLEEDRNSQDSQEVFDAIYVFDHEKVNSSSFPHSYNYRIIDKGNKQYIFLDYMYRTRHSAILAYVEGDIKLIKNERE